MKYDEPSSDNPAGRDWVLLGQIELTPRPGIGEAISLWIEEILNPFKPHADFLDKVTRSAQDAAIRAITSERVRSEFGHVHLRVFSSGKPADIPTTNSAQTRGFFRIEKVGASAENADPRAHAIELYLYPDG